MNKKADISMGIIVMAAIGMLVLVVLIAIFWGKANIFASSTGSCIEKKGECKEPRSCAEVSIGRMDCAENQVCCIPVGG